MRRLIHHRGRDLAIGLVLAMMMFRAYVPVGFMPASGTPFGLEICPSGPYAAPHAHHLHAHHAPNTGNHADFDSCPFGSAPAAAPVLHIVAFDPPEHLVFQSLFAFSPAPPAIHLSRAHRARAPPFLD